MGYTETYNGELDADQRDRLDAWLKNFVKAGASAEEKRNRRKIVANIMAEETLPSAKLKKFLAELDPAKTEIADYKAVCLAHHLEGRKAKTKATVLHKVIGEKAFNLTHARVAGIDTGSLSAKNRIRNWAPTKQLKEVKRLDLAAPQRVAWATFFTSSEKRNFISGKNDHDFIFRILGLGHYIGEKGAVLLTYNVTDIGRGQPADFDDSLRVPTVADADDGQYFKPSPKNAPYGTTAPIRLRGPGLPEIVHGNRKADIVNSVEFRG